MRCGRMKTYMVAVGVGAGVMGVVLGAGRPAVRGKEAPEHDFQKWQTVVREELGPNLAGGYAFAVMEKGEVVFSVVEGYARSPKEKENPGVRWTLDQQQGLASVSKEITAVAVMHLFQALQEEGRKISIDDAFWPMVRRQVPDAGEQDKKITVRQLLQHTSGFPHVKEIGDCQTPGALEKLMKAPMAHKPGETGDYDNNNYYALHLVIEELSHYSYTGYVKKEVLRPMGIGDMETHYNHELPTLGYTDAKGKKPGFAFDWDTTAWAGAAGWYGSVDDLCLFLKGLREGKVLNEASTKELLDNNFGWDGDHPWVKDGEWGWETDQVAGTVQSAILHGEDDTDAVLLVNCATVKGPHEVLADAWKGSKRK